MIALLLLLLFQTPAVTEDKEVLAIADSARALAPEFASDILSKLAASRLIPAQSAKRELIEEAFEIAANAELPYPYDLSGTSTDSLSNITYRDVGLDVISLRAAAVQAMLAIDPARALMLFQRIVIPEIPGSTCEAHARPDLTAYYETAAAVFARGFDKRQRSEARHLDFLVHLVGNVSSHASAVAAFGMLMKVEVPQDARDRLLTALAGVMDRITATDRDFSASAMSLIHPAATTPSWIASVRSYLVRHAQADRCADTLKRGPLPPAVLTFNKHYSRPDAREGPYMAMAPEEVGPGKVAGSYREDHFWTSERSKQVLAALQWLNHGNRKLPDSQRFWTEAERNTPEWNARSLELVKLIEGWKESEEKSPAGYTFMVAHTYLLQARLVPGESARSRNFEAWLSFLESRYPAASSRNAWFSQVKNIFGAGPLLDRLAASRNPVIATYAALYVKLR